MLKSLLATNNPLSKAETQLDKLAEVAVFPFGETVKKFGLTTLQPRSLSVFQLNLGKMCNQACAHCHVDAGPDRKEIMTREVMQACLDAIRVSGAETVDLTGGAPEMNPDFRWLVEQLTAINVHVIVRCNLTIILANKKYHDLPDFFKNNNVEVISSLPCYTQQNTDAQRGDGVFEKSIKALKMLNEVGYGLEGSELKLHLVYNPGGASLPGNQQNLERDYKKRLKEDFDIEFTQLYTITNLPISRFLDSLIEQNKLEEYMEKLVNAYNPEALDNVMCRDMISVGWDGGLYDCDFNQMLEMKVASTTKRIEDFNKEQLMDRNIRVHQHCYGCTAGAGSSCGGALV